jgi:allantoicase
VFDPELYGPQGKVMDSWESVRHNPYDRDFVEFSLKKPLSLGSRPIYAEFSTAFHDGNHPDDVRVLAKSSKKNVWVEIVPKQSLEGHSLLKVKVDPHEALGTDSFDWIRVEMFPDGGLSRFGLYDNLPPEAAVEFLPPGQARSQRLKDPVPTCLKPLAIPYKNLVGRCDAPKQMKDYASALAGAQVVRASNQHYGPADQVISPFEPVHMFDGLETKRSRVSGHFEEVEIKLGAHVAVKRVVADFKYFVNNNPMFMTFLAWHQDHWEEFIPKTSVKGFAALQKAWVLDTPTHTDRILVRIYPDGGVHRIHVYDS